MRLRLSTALLLVVALFGAAAGSYLLRPHSRVYSGLQVLEWDSDGCRAATRVDSDIRILTSKLQDGVLRCTSQWLQARAEGFNLEYSGAERALHNSSLRVDLEANGTLTSLPIRLPNTISESHWTREFIALPAGIERYRLVVELSAEGPAYFALRNRLELATGQGEGMPRGRALAQVVLVISAVAFSILLCGLFREVPPISATGKILLFTLISLAVHYRPENSFFADDWTILEQSRSLGLSGLFAPHNEHRLPVFRLLFWIEQQLFGGWYSGYLLVSALLHAATALLLVSIVQQLSPRARGTALVLPVLYLVSGLHAEALQWVVVQSALLCGFFFAAALDKALKFSGSSRELLLVGVLLSLSGLSFGVGLITPLLLIWFVLWAPLREGLSEHRRQLCFAALAALVVLASCYRSAAPSAFDLNASVRYLLMGGYFGSFTKSLGFIPFWRILPFTEPKEVEQIAKLYPGALRNALGVEGVAMLPGALLSLALLLASLLRRRIDSSPLRYWFIGQGVVLGAFVLQALGRSQMGEFQSLAGRYQYLALMGVELCFAPWVALFEERFRRGATPLSRTLLLILVTWLVWSQLCLGSSLRYYRERGAETRYFLAAVRDWNTEGSAAYEGQDSERYGLEPLYYVRRGDAEVQQATIVHPVVMDELVSRKEK
ncbi:MAG: hypothetical protein U0136_14350 [Bdellovibrionota bacterium]